MKQKNNSQFAFLDIEHKLNLYYRFLVQQIRSGAYRPLVSQNGEDKMRVPKHEYLFMTFICTYTHLHSYNHILHLNNSLLLHLDSDSESGSDSDGGYLHPSLFASKNTVSSGPPEALKNIFKAQASKSKATCAYSQLIDKIRPSLDIDQEGSPSCENTCSIDSMSGADSNGARDDGTGNNAATVEFESLVAIMPPPPDVQPIVDKMAEYVAKNGLDFEASIRAKGYLDLFDC